VVLLEFAGLTALLIASVAFSSSAIFIRLAVQVSAFSLVFFRLLISSSVVVVFGLLKHNLRLLRGRDLLLVTFSGAFLSLHFAAFIAAVKETTVANATFLVYTSPIMLAILTPLILKERTTWREYAAVLIASIGVLFVAHSGNGFSDFGFGDVSALLAAVFVTFYSIIGRFLRTSGITTTCYISYVYSVAAVLSFMMAQAFGASTFGTYDTSDIVAIIALAIIPTLVGHSLYNYALNSVKIVTAIFSSN